MAEIIGHVTLVGRLALRDLTRRPGEAALLLIVIVAATTTLTLGLVVRGVVSDPFGSTRAATAAPDVVAIMAPPQGETPGRPSGEPTDSAALEDLIDTDGVVSHSGPYPVASAEMTTRGQDLDVQVMGRDTAPSQVDIPEITQGDWVRNGGAVLEAAFAASIDMGVGDHIELNGHRFEVVGIGVTAASSPYPHATCYFACAFGASPDVLTDLPGWVLVEPGLIWVTRSDVWQLASEPDSMPLVLYMQLEDSEESGEFVDAHSYESPDVPQLLTWQDILVESSDLVRDAQTVFLLGSGLLSLMAMATVAVMVVGRMADHSRRVGLLKVVGATPGLVTAVMLAEYVAVALLAALVGLVLGWLAAPLLTEPSAGLLGAATPSLRLSTVALVGGVALTVAVIATFVPALRAARVSTVVALTDAAHAPRRHEGLVAVSARLPVPLLLALRTLGRRPRRVVFSILGIAVTVSGVVAALAGKAQLDEQLADGGFRAESVERLWPVLMGIMATLVVLAAVNALMITWATVLDTRHASAVARALGATPQQVSFGIAGAQILPALVGATLGVPGGVGLLYLLDDDVSSLPPLWQFAFVVFIAVVVVAFLAAIAARAGGRRSVAEVIQSEHA